MTIDNLEIRDITEREIEIIELIAQGLTNSEIADQLFLSKNTIKWYVQQLNQKLYTNGRDEIVKEANRIGLLDLSDNSTFNVIRTNLPNQTTPFIGREADLDQLQQLLKNRDVRLLTILAPGGMGKTRIALELAQQQLGDYSDGVYFVPFQTIDEPEQILTHIADHIGFQAGAKNNAIKQQVLYFLAKKSMLILLDNFEQVLDGAEVVNDILVAAPGVKVIITSREKLNLLGETVFTLQGMYFENCKTTIDAVQYDAIQLLRKTARRVRPEWEITGSNLEPVVRICELTGGMPLGIILAISWLDVYDIERIADEIQKSVDILTTKMRDIPARQRSIRAIFDNTWHQLSADERDVLMKLSLFRMGFTQDALQDVASATPVLLQDLVSKALINQVHNGRFDVHELLRQYLEEQLILANQNDSTRKAHMDFYANLLCSRENDLKNHQQIDAMRLLEHDWENIHLAWDYAIASGDIDVLARMLEPIRLFSLLSNRMDRYEIWLKDAINEMPSSARDLLTKLHIYYADTLIELSLTEQSFEILKQYESDVEELDSPVIRALCLVTLSRTSYILGDPESSLDYAKAYLELAIEAGETWHHAQAHYALSLISGLWDSREPLRHIDACITISKSIGDRYWLSQGYILGGLMLARTGQIEQAQSYTELGYQTSKELNNKGSMVAAAGNLSAFTKAQGAWKRSEDLQLEALSLAQDLEYSHNQVDMLIKLGELHLLQGKLDSARAYLSNAEQLLKNIDYPATSSRYYVTQSALREFYGDYEGAHELALKAVDYIKTNVNWSISQNAIQRLAWTLCCRGFYKKARDYLIQITRQELQSKYKWDMLRNLALLSFYETHQGRFDNAAEMLACVDHHPIQSVWLQEHPALKELRERLHDAMGEEKYLAGQIGGQQQEVAILLSRWLHIIEDD